jgi:hypothetical protein
MARPRKRTRMQGSVVRGGSGHARSFGVRVIAISSAAVAVVALVAVLPQIAAPATSLLAFTSSAFAKDGGGDNDSREFNRQMQEQVAEQQRQAAEQQRQAAQAAADAAKRMQEQQRQAQEQQQQAARQAQQQQSQQQSTSSDDDNARSVPRQTRSWGETQRQNGSSNRNDDSGTRSSDNGQSKSSNKDSKNDDGKDSSKTDDGEGNSQASGDSGQTSTDNNPPATMEKWLKQVSTPKKAESNVPPQDGKTKWKADTKPAADQKADPKQATATAKSAKPATGGRPPPIAMPDLATPDVLAVNASRQTLERAKALGFKARPSAKFSSLGMAVTALVPPDGMNPAEAKALLSRDMPQSSFAPNQKYRIYRTASGNADEPTGTRAAAIHKPGAPTDCSGDHCFGRDIIGWKPELRSCVNGVRVGIIDTSVDVAHPAFAGKKLEIHHFGADGAPAGPDWHGTGVTALLAGDASSGTPGMIPDANFFIADIFHADADKEPASDTVSMLRAFDWLDAKGVKIVNMSLSGPPDDVIRSAIEKMAAKGVLFVAAAGNEGPNAAPSYPAAYEQVIAVTAVTKDLQSYRYANRGSYIDVAAPGVSIWTALPGSKEGYHSGTSFATPYVTAALAALYPGLTTKTQAEALQKISYKDLGAPGRDPIYGQGLLVAPASCSGGQVASAPEGMTQLGGPMAANQAPAPAALAATPANAPANSEPLSWFGFLPAGK